MKNKPQSTNPGGYPPGKSLIIKTFTLIELLIVVAIIAILAGMLLPALNKARKSALVTNCISNSKSIGQMVQQYAFDNNDQLPDGTQADYSNTCYGHLVWYGTGKGAGLGKTFTGVNNASQLDKQGGRILFCTSAILYGKEKFPKQMLDGADNFRRSTYYYYWKYKAKYMGYVASRGQELIPETTASIDKYGDSSRLSDRARYKGIIAGCGYLFSNETRFPVLNGHNDGLVSVIPFVNCDGSVKVGRYSYNDIMTNSGNQTYEYFFNTALLLMPLLNR